MTLTAILDRCWPATARTWREMSLGRRYWASLTGARPRPPAAARVPARRRHAARHRAGSRHRKASG